MKLVLVSILLAIAGCSNCPIEPPDCCDNVIFGCGPFDLPDGCTCDE